MSSPPSSFGEGAGGASFELALDRGVHAPALARAAMSDVSEELRLDSSSRSTLLLLVSEVVSNAVLHSSGPEEEPIVLTATVEDSSLRVSVTDGGPGFTPVDRDPDRLEGGYGLFLLEKAAERWGVDGSDSTRVWFELPLRAPAPSR
jgi:anti-sigma regulatory factor (Ser/Thr protein kinase)